MLLSHLFIELLIAKPTNVVALFLSSANEIRRSLLTQLAMLVVKQTMRKDYIVVTGQSRIFVWPHRLLIQWDCG